MGGALLEGWLQAGLAPERIAVIEPDPAPAIAGAPRCARRSSGFNPDATAIAEAAAIVIAVKRNCCRGVITLAPGHRPGDGRDPRRAAGTNPAIADTLPQARALVRAMPNTPAAIGRGITVAVPRHMSATPSAIWRTGS